MSHSSASRLPGTDDPVSNVLKWILLAVAVVTFALLVWATVATYERAPPQPERFVGPGGTVLMTADDILAGKAGFQKADLMDYGSLYGMGSYYGQDYTAWALMRLAGLTEERIAQAQLGRSFDALPPDQQAAVRNVMREQLQRVDLTRRRSPFPTPLPARSPHCATRSPGRWRPPTSKPDGRPRTACHRTLHCGPVTF